MRASIYVIVSLAMLLVGGCASLSQARPAEPLIPDAPVQLDMEIPQGGGPSVRVYLNGRGPYLFFLDTGTGVSRISARLARELQLEETRARLATRGLWGRQTAPTKMVRLRSLRLGAVECRDQLLGVMANEELRSDDVQYDGLLGFGLFTSCTLTLDFPGRRIVLDAPGRLSERDVDGYPAFPLRLDSQCPVMPMVVQDQHGAFRRLDALIDTGSQAPLVLPPQAKGWPFVTTQAGSGVATDITGEKIRVNQMRLHAQVVVGGLGLNNPVVAYIDTADGHGNVGVRHLEDCVVTFDPSQSRVSVRRPRQPALPTSRAVTTRNAMDSASR